MCAHILANAYMLLCAVVLSAYYAYRSRTGQRDFFSLSKVSDTFLVAEEGTIKMVPHPMYGMEAHEHT